MKFLSVVTGETLGCHQEINRHLSSRGWTEVDYPEDGDVTVVYCPVVSRLGTDIQAALEKIPSGIPVILVVLHHTFSPAFCVPDSGRHATSAVSLTVDMLFHQTCGLLRCSTNDIAIQTIFNQYKSNNASKNHLIQLFQVYEREIIFILFFLLLLLIGWVIIYGEELFYG